MNLTEHQADSLTELINIAFGRTAASLSELTGHRVILDSPTVMVLPLDQLAATLSRYVPGEVASIHQDFTGPIAGDALLVLSQSGAAALASLLTDTAPAERLDDSAREVLTEVGNILLNACLGMFGNLLQVRVNFSVPRLHLDTVDQLVASLSRPSGPARHALVVSMAFRMKGSAVTGYLALVLGVASLEQLVDQVAAWEERGEGAP
ncbi:MAG: chemotaxis protein CheC [Polyangiales bacterium]